MKKSKVNAKKDNMQNLKLKLQEKLDQLKQKSPLDEWHDGVQYGKESMLEDIIEMLNQIQ